MTRDRQHSTTWALHEDNPKDSKHLNECPGSRDLAKSIGITKAVGEAFMNQVPLWIADATSIEGWWALERGHSVLNAGCSSTKLVEFICQTLHGTRIFCLH